MSPIKLGKERGPAGLARLSINAKGRIMVSFEDGSERRELFPEDNEEYMPIIKSLQEAKALSKPLFVRMNKEGTKIFGLTPPPGNPYICMFKSFTAKKDEPPMPYPVETKNGVKNGKSWTIPAHLEFRAIFTVVAGVYKGLEVVVNFNYAFKEDVDDLTQIVGAGMNKLEEFLRRCGMDFSSDSIPYSDNVLPYIENILQQRQVPVIVNLKPDGYLDNITSVPDGTIEIPKKKVAKK